MLTAFEQHDTQSDPTPTDLEKFHFQNVKLSNFLFLVFLLFPNDLTRKN